MEYFQSISIFLMVLSPLFIPVGVTIVHTVRNWHPRVPVLDLAAVAAIRRRQRRELAAELF